MLRSLTYNSAIKLVMGLLIFIISPGCLSIKTIPLKKLPEVQAKRYILFVHSGDSSWYVNNFQVKDSIIKGTIYKKAGSISKSHLVNIYVGPVEAVKIQGNQFTVSKNNVGKVDYKTASIVDILSAILLIYIITFG